MRQGLMSVVPESVLALLTWGNLERGVCGDRDISLAHLKTACKYTVSVSVKNGASVDGKKRNL